MFRPASAFRSAEGREAGEGAGVTNKSNVSRSRFTRLDYTTRSLCLQNARYLANHAQTLPPSKTCRHDVLRPFCGLVIGCINARPDICDLIPTSFLKKSPRSRLLSMYSSKLCVMFQIIHHVCKMQRKVAKFHGKQLSVILFQFCQGCPAFYHVCRN